MAIPKIIRDLRDGNLERPVNAALVNRHVLIIGTAEDGPLYTPILLRDVNHAQDVFGVVGKGSLVRSINEAIVAQSGSEKGHQVSAMRIGGSASQKAILTLDDGTNDVLEFEALYPGDIYNDIAVQLTSANEVKIYNPKSQIWSVFTFSSDPDDSTVDVHSTAELADAINADVNLNVILVAKSKDVSLHYEIQANTADAPVVSSSSSETIIDISLIDLTPVTGDLVETKRILDGASPVAPSSAQLNNDVSAIESVYAISDSAMIELEISGKTSIKLAKNPLDGKLSTIFKTVLGCESVRHASGTFLQLTTTGESVPVVISEAYLRHRSVVIENNLSIAGAATDHSLTITAPWGMAWETNNADDFFAAGSYHADVDAEDIREPLGSLFHKAAIAAVTFTGSGLDDATSGGAFVGVPDITYTVEIDGNGTPDTFRWSKNGGSTWEAETVSITAGPDALDNGVTITFAATTGHGIGDSWEFTATAGKAFKLEWRAQGADANDWNEIVVPLSSIAATTAWAAGVLTIDLDDDDNVVADLRSAALGGSLRITFDSCIQNLSEHATKTAMDAGGGFTDYFIRGQELLIGAVAPANLVLRYATVTNYELDSTLTLLESTSGPQMKLIGEGIQPGSGGGAVDGTNDVIIGFKYRISPEWIVLSVVKGFQNGTNGTNLSKAQLYEELTEAYNNLDAYNFNVLAVPGAYFDSTKTAFNPNSGLPETKNAGFQNQMSNFLQDYNGEAIGIISFEPIVGSGVNGTITRSDVKTRVSKLTVVDFAGDPLRAANFIEGFNQKFMVAVDLEGVFSVSGQPYTSTGEAAVAGHLATLDPNESIYLSTIPGLINTRYKYASKVIDGRSQLDALSDARIIGHVIEDTGIRLVDGPTLAAPGSDYERLTTIWITAKAMEITRRVGKNYLGKPANIQTLEALNTRLRRELTTMVPNNLTAFTFQIKSSPSQRVLGKFQIVLFLVPVFEIREITVPVILKSDESALAQLLES